MANCVEAWTQHMRGYVGLDAEREPEAFGALCAPQGPASARAFVCRPNVPGGTNSSCMLVAVGGLELFLANVLVARGGAPAQLDGPLGFDRWGKASELARNHGALIERPDDTWGPELGDIVHVSREVNGHSALHWFTLVQQNAKGWRSVDGGQMNEHGYQAVHELDRSFLAQPVQHNVLELQSWKAVASVIRVSKLLESLEL